MLLCSNTMRDCARLSRLDPHCDLDTTCLVSAGLRAGLRLHGCRRRGSPVVRGGGDSRSLDIHWTCGFFGGRLAEHQWCTLGSRSMAEARAWMMSVMRQRVGLPRRPLTPVQYAAATPRAHREGMRAALRCGESGCRCGPLSLTMRKQHAGVFGRGERRAGGMGPAF